MRRKWKWPVFAVLLVAAGMLYVRAKIPANNAVTIASMVQNPYNIQAIDSAVHLVQDGDIVVRTGNDMTSYMFCRAALMDKTYSHCGMVVMENGYPFVYHAIGGEDNPEETLRKDSLKFWLSPAHNTGFGICRFPLSAAQKDTMLALAQRYYLKHTLFDLKFDMKDDSKLYCAELVYRAMNKAMDDSSFIKPTHAMGYTYVAVDNITAAPGAEWIWQMRYK